MSVEARPEQENGDRVDCRGCGDPLTGNEPLRQDNEGFTYHAHCVDSALLWARNDIQFPRLIAEAEAAGAFTEEVLAAMCESMDLDANDLIDLIDRAQAAWDDAKEAI